MVCKFTSYIVLTTIILLWLAIRKERSSFVKLRIWVKENFSFWIDVVLIVTCLNTCFASMPAITDLKEFSRSWFRLGNDLWVLPVMLTNVLRAGKSLFICSCNCLCIILAQPSMHTRISCLIERALKVHGCCLGWPKLSRHWFLGDWCLFFGVNKATLAFWVLAFQRPCNVLNKYRSDDEMIYHEWADKKVAIEFTSAV